MSKLWQRIKIAWFILRNGVPCPNPSYDCSERYWQVIYELYKSQNKIRRLERAMKVKYGDHVELIKHLGDLEKKNKNLKKEVRNMQIKAEEFNRKLYATGLIVNCTGCWGGRPFEGEKLTQEKVDEIIHLANRLKSWWTNNKNRKEYLEIQK